VEAKYPELISTIRERDTGQRRSLVRFNACGEDLSHDSPDASLPNAVASGVEPFLIVGAMAGG
jgi:molybdopterin synthase sulfur carrier subunit